MLVAPLRVPLFPGLCFALASCTPAPAPPAATTPLATHDFSLLRALALDPDTRMSDDGHPAPATPTIGSAAAALSGSAPAFIARTRSGDDAARATDCLTAAVYYEARSESLDGQRAVAQVVLNRVRDHAFPASVCGVVYQHGVRRDGRGMGCQFSFACDGSTGRTTDPSAWHRARLVAEAALAGAVYAPIGAATYYHTTAVHPWWASSLNRIGQIGTHIFYGWHSAMAAALSFRQDYAGVEPTVVPPSSGSMTPVAVVAGTPEIMVHRGGSLVPPEVAVPRDTSSADTPDASRVAVAVTMGVRIHRHHGTAAGPMIATVGPEEGSRDDQS